MDVVVILTSSTPTVLQANLPLTQPAASLGKVSRVATVTMHANYCLVLISLYDIQLLFVPDKRNYGMRRPAVVCARSRAIQESQLTPMKP